MDDFVDISIIEQYNYCPRQAQNVLSGINIFDPDMQDGSDWHEEQRDKKKIHELFKKSRVGGVGALPDNPSEIREALKTGQSKRFVEVYVKSYRYGISGFIDEVEIANSGEVYIVEYKTTFSGEKTPYMIESALVQARAYAIAFREHYKYKGEITIIIRRIYLKYDWVGDIDKEPAVYNYDEENKEYPNNCFTATMKVVYNQPFNPDYDDRDILEIVEKIRSKNFSHVDNKNKCDKCQYNKVCEFSILRV